MTTTLGPDDNVSKFPPRGTATRTQTTNIVPSQFTERIQAGNIPEIWPEEEVSLVERASRWWIEVSDSMIFWKILLTGIAIALFVFSLKEYLR